MMYADTGFLMALLKDSDWLKQPAREFYREHEGDIFTSHVALNELLILCEREGFDPVEKLTALEMLIEIEGDIDRYLEAAHYMKKHGLHTFDALHVAFSEDRKILTTDNEIQELADSVNFEE